MTNENELRRTPLYASHVANGGKIVPFAGWEMPVQYAGLIQEHHAVRTSAGLFDVSHMGEILVTGPEAEKLINYLTCNDVSTLTDFKAQYNALLNEQGGVIDDIIVYRYSFDRFLICVNASNARKDYEWITSKNTFTATVEDLSSEFGQIAVQGPKSAEILSSLPDFKGVEDLSYFTFTSKEFKGSPVVVARTGYTGEDGFEIFVPWNDTVALWDAIRNAGDVQLCGLGARDTLRLEAAYPLHGHELGEDISALESGLGWIVKLNKGDFIGRDALLKQKEAGLARALIGFTLDGAGIARHGDEVYSGDTKIGVVTSGTKTPTINKALGLALLEKGYAVPGTAINVRVRGRDIAAVTAKPPFYSALKKK